MEIIPGFFMPLWSIITAISAVSAIIILIILRIFLNISFLRFCDRAFNDREAMEIFKKKYSGSKLLKRSRFIEKSAEKNGKGFIVDIGIDKLWEQQFLNYKKTGYLKKFIKYFPEKGLFFCIIAGQNKSSYQKIFQNMVSQNNDANLLKKIGAAGDGTDFDGKYTASMLEDRFQEIIELTGEAEWPVRFFAVKLLIYINKPRALRSVWEAFSDSSKKIRETVAAEFNPEDRKKLGSTLKELLLDDPCFEVRRAARLRLDKEFPELYRMDTASLAKPRLIHLLGHLHDNSDEDQNTALKFLLSEDLEVRLQAALYLQRQKVLNRIFTETKAGDRTEFERSLNLLTCACEVNCTSFLNELDHTDNPASVQLAAELLRTNSSKEYIDKLALKIFNPSTRTSMREHFDEIYKKTIESISLRGTDKALQMLNQELLSKADDGTTLDILLPLLPERGEYIFIPSLLSFLKSDDCPRPELLRKTIERFPPCMYIEELVSLLRNAGSTSHSVRKEAFKILGELKMACCLQIILENLNLLSPAERKDFASLMSVFDQEAFEDRVSGLLNSVDSTVKAALISALPSTGIKRFITEIKDSSKDPDPDVRAAGIWALAGYGEIKLLSQMTSMLRDPVERVRRETAEVIASYGTPAALLELEKIIEDENEVMPVKAAAIYGLGHSPRVESIAILVDILQNDELRQEAVQALSLKKSLNELKALIELFKDSPPQLREYIAEVFKMMGKSIEPAVITLLSEDISSLREIIAEILHKTGFIETTVRKLRHRNSLVRKNAATVLSMIQTREAFKGIVLAARDPDQDVRVEVLKAIEKLNSPDGVPILNELKEDPDRRVRKFTLWAMERIDAKNLNE
ncbi:MAG: HEAT repeat domain-containing protein [Spirochaetales bacterium]|nr:HEAT repeat domain-containing protein [Spirochaetales bacterium]